MRVSRRDAHAASQAMPLPAEVELRATQLLPTLFADLFADLLADMDAERPLTVLDVGTGVAETVAFFAQYRCRLYFGGLFDAPELQAIPDEDPEPYLERAFASLCDFPAGTRFDLCLLWDFPNYLTAPALRAFAGALRPYLHRDTRGHGFGAFKSTAPAMAREPDVKAQQYGIYEADKLVVRPRTDGVMAGHPHSRSVLAESLDCFEIVRGTLLREANMELLFRARYAGGQPRG